MMISGGIEFNKFAKNCSISQVDLGEDPFTITLLILLLFLDPFTVFVINRNWKQSSFQNENFNESSSSGKAKENANNATDMLIQNSIFLISNTSQKRNVF